MPAKEEVDALVGVHTEELADNLDSQDLRVVKLRSGATPTDAAPLEPVVDETEDGTMKVLRFIMR